MQGGAHLRQVFDWLETTYGEYLFGDEVGSVSVAWGPGAYGGMEHHPYWHVASGADHVKAETGYDPTACAMQWLAQDPLPGSSVCP